MYVGINNILRIFVHICLTRNLRQELFVSGIARQNGAVTCRVSMSGI
jgi:hypothetical protein